MLSASSVSLVEDRRRRSHFEDSVSDEASTCGRVVLLAARAIDDAVAVRGVMVAAIFAVVAGCRSADVG